MEHEVEVHVRKIREAVGRIEQDLLLLRREVDLFLQHDERGSWGTKQKEDLSQEDVTDGPVDTIERMLAIFSGRAKTKTPLPLSRAFRPSKVGFTGEHFKSLYPDVEPNETLEKFLTFYISRGDVAVNWFEKFLNWSQEAQRRALLAKKEHRVETDSMGLPLDPKLRRRMNGNPDDPEAAQRIDELKERQDSIYESLTDDEKEMLK